MHACIERDQLGQPPQWLSAQSEEQRQYEEFRASISEAGWRSYRPEWRIYSEELGIAGTLDCLMTNDAGEFLLIDWKRSKEIKTSNRFEKALPPISGYDNCNFIQYSLQLNLYKYILEQYYGLKIKEMKLCSFHPKQPKAKIITVADMQSTITKMIESWHESHGSI